jgi:hypothetical protein
MGDVTVVGWGVLSIKLVESCIADEVWVGEFIYIYSLAMDSDGICIVAEGWTGEVMYLTSLVLDGCWRMLGELVFVSILSL